MNPSTIKWACTMLFFFYTANALAQNPVKLRREASFFGVHFDLHADEDITDAGKTLTYEMIDSFLKKVRPDFIQIDCKGHPGISSYPTKVGYHVKSFEKDPLKLWREVTEKNKVGLYMHYSGVWDAKAAAAHPEWAMIKTNGERSTQKISFFSPYLDSLLIPQLKELSSVYRVDGAWIDGDCWAVETDYSESAIKKWKEKTGNNEVPKKKGDPLFPEYLEFTRGLFRDYMARYVNAIHQFDPKFQITSNWAYSSIMPEKAENNVDFLSGDVTPQDGVFRSAFEARVLAPQGKPWDLMAWGFSWNGNKMPMSNKSAVQLKQEAAEVMAMGGGIQFYFTQNRDLSLKPWLANILSDLGQFCRERQPYCHKAEAIPQVALLFPTGSYQQNASVPYSGAPGKLPATLYALLDNQYPVEVLMEHHLKGKTKQYPMIVIPECNSIAPALLTELKEYVQDGGKLLIIGTETAKLFSQELGLVEAVNSEEKVAFISAANRLGGIRSPLLEITPGNETKPISHFYNSNDYLDKSKHIASSVRNMGKGKIAAVYFDAGSSYAEFKTPVIRDFIAEAVAALDPSLMTSVKGSQLVHVSLNKLNGKSYINLINVAGEHTNKAAIGYDQVPALTNIKVSIKGKPAKIILQPEGKTLNFKFENGRTTFVVPKIEIHTIAEIVD